jgi:hypothetical protein
VSRVFLALLFGVVLAGSQAFADGWEDVPVAQFLAAVRDPQTSPYWARMEGEVRHMDKKTRKTWRSSIEFRMNVAKDLVEAQLQFAGRERYRTRQVFARGLEGQQVTVEVAPNPFGRKLADAGIQPADLTFGFLYWDLVKEEASEKVSGLKCRVLRVRHPEIGDEAKLWIVTNRLAPLRVQWFRKGMDEPYRELRFKGGKERRGFWLPAEIELQGGDAWKSLVKFGKTEIEATNESGVPADLFVGSSGDQ